MSVWTAYICRLNGGIYVNKEVCVNIELFLLVFVHEKSPRRAFAARE